tara:strand:- start:219 stop:914 length:696 start_codon:yes stop_codon:yes gene_type:complete
MAYASGKKALAICDRCGFRYRLHELKKEWNGLKTCPNCFETKHPQLEPHTSPSDPQAIFEPRPDTDKEVGQGFVISNNDNIISSSIAGFRVDSALGEITVGGTSTVTPTPSPTPAPTPAPSITTYTVTVASYYGSNYFYINGSRQATLDLTEGSTYRFDQSDSSNSGHPLRFSTTSNGTHGGGSEYTTGVTTSGTPGSSGAYTQIEVASGAPTLYYYCTNHSGMGGTINTT